ncbi:MAG: hypothetical protein JSV82_08340 [Planctomycetota bacterium]|nr:MAG: hypothetical protein JSV82_08340 [Planctomycetota bacterium]
MLLILVIIIFSGFALNNWFLKNVLAGEQASQEDENGRSFSVFFMVEPLGIATLTFVSATLLTGLFRRKLGRRFLKLHLTLAIISVILGFTHGILVLVLFG